jgi:PAS domain S-box-containing protein
VACVEADVAVERRRLYDLLDSLPVMIALITREHRVAFANSAFKNEFGDIVGPTCHQYYFGLEKPCEFCKAFKVFSTGRAQHWETPARNGRVFEVFDMPFRDVDGTEMILEMDVDVTASRQQASELVDAKAELSKRAVEAEDLANQLIRYAPTGIFTIEFDPPRFTSVNEAMVRLTGYGRQELLGMDPFDILDEESAKLFRSRVVLTLSGDDTEPEVEYRLARKDGSQLIAVLNAHYERDQNGRVTGALVIAHDVTARRHAEEEARRDEELQAFILRFSDMLRPLEDPQVVKEAAARALAERLCVAAVGYMEVEIESDLATAGGEYSDGSLADTKGTYRLEEFGSLGEHLRTGTEFVSSDVMSDARSDDALKTFARGLRLRATAFIPLMNRGKLVAYLYAGAPLPREWTEDDRTLLRVVAERTWEAVERAQAQTALRESEERFRAVLENAVDAAYRRDLQTDNYDYMSPVIESITGFEPDEFVGLTVDEVIDRIHPDDRAHVEECLRQAEVTGELSCEYRFRRKDGRFVWLGDHAKVMRDADGTPRYLSGTVLDASRRVAAEEGLRRTIGTVRALVDREEALKEVAQIAAASLAKGALAARISERVASILGACKANVRLLNSDGTALVTIGSFGIDPASESAAPMPVDAQTQTAQVFRSGEPVVQEDLLEGTNPQTKEVSSRIGVRSHAVLPIIVEGRPAGVFNVGWDHPRTFAPEDVSFMRALTAQFAVGLYNARLFEAQQQRRRRIEALHEVLEQAVSAPDLRTASQKTLDYLARHHDFDLAAIWLASRDVLELVAYTGFPSSYERLSPLSIDSPLDAAAAYRTGRPVVVAHPDNPAVVEAYRSMGLDLHSYVVLPLRGRQRPIGVLAFVWTTQQPVSQYDLDFYESVAAEIAVVLENGQLYESEREAARLGTALAELDRHIHSSLAFSDVAHQALEQGARVLGAESAVLNTVTDRGWETRYDFGFDPPVEGLRFEENEIPHAMLALERGEPVAVDDASTDPRVNTEVMERYGIKSVIVAPLIVRGQALGVLFYNFHHQPHAFTSQEIEFVTRLSSSLSLAVENARLYETEHDIAETLQETLVVLPSRVPGIAFSRGYQSATYQSGRVGGDFVDVFEVHGHILGLALGDVSGKGIDAAVTTSLIRTTLRVHALDGLSPQQIGEKANRMIHRFTAADTFVTLWFGLLNTRNGQLRYISAGHPPAMVMSASGDVRELTWGDSVVGAVEGATYRQREDCLRLGDRLLLYSDGVTEARSPEGRFLGHEGLLEILRQNRRTLTGELANAIMDEIIAFSHGVLRDDAAILAVEPIRLKQR